jgi:hypothetical protein
MSKIRIYQTSLSFLLIVFFTLAFTNQINAANSFSSVENMGQAETVLKEAQNILQAKFNMTFRYPIIVKLVSGKELDEIAKNSKYKGAIVGLHTFREGKHQVFMMNNVGRDNFFGTLCHELTHGWQSENCPSQDIVLKEGTAVWVEYKCLLQYGAVIKARNLSERIADPVYGVGYRFVQKIEDKYGEKKVLDEVKKLQKIS